MLRKSLWDCLSLVRSFGRSFVWSFPHIVVHSFPRLVVPSFVRAVVPSFGRAVVPSFGRSLVWSFGRSLVQSCDRSLVQSCDRSLVWSCSRAVALLRGSDRGRSTLVIRLLGVAQCNTVYCYNPILFRIAYPGLSIHELTEIPKPQRGLISLILGGAYGTGG